jgi:hypothetical protein
MLELAEDCPATANAGPDQVVECTGSTEVTLDGSASAEDGQELTYTWTGDFVGGTASGVSPTVVFEDHGQFTVSLVVTDGAAESSPDTVVIDIRDTRPPVLRVCDVPSKIWPPNGEMVTIEPVVMAVDDCDGFDVDLTLEIATSEPFDDEGDVVIRTPWDFDVRAERRGSGCGRIYYLRWTATDQSGNSATFEDEILVPHDKGWGWFFGWDDDCGCGDDHQDDGEDRHDDHDDDDDDHDDDKHDRKGKHHDD